LQLERPVEQGSKKESNLFESSPNID